MPISAQHLKAARLHLGKCDPIMKKMMKRVGPCKLKTRRDRFLALVNSIIAQQISVAAANSVQRRLVELIAPEKICADTLVKLDAPSLREAGISRQKAGYLLDLSEKIVAGEVQLQTLGRKDNESVIQELTQVKGIGRWTAQMFLMFTLGRLDVFPIDDLGIRNAMKKAYAHDPDPDVTWYLEIAEPWAPYQTVACWYLWQSLELD